MKVYDVAIIGAGAAGMFCAIHAAQKGLKVAIVEKNKKVGSKLRICGGGRCNITNKNIQAQAFLSNNPKFCRSALARYTQWDFLDWFESQGLTYHEKKLGQLFCDQRSQGLIDCFQQLLSKFQIDVHYQCSVQAVQNDDQGVLITTETADFKATKCVISSGGPSFAKLGASDDVLRWAKKLQVKNIPFRPALVPFVLHPPISHLSGISCLVRVGTQHSPIFEDDLLFTHKGLSGPAILQISSYWHKGEIVTINFIPHISKEQFQGFKKNQPQRNLLSLLQNDLPTKLLEYLLAEYGKSPLQEINWQTLDQIFDRLQAYQLQPQGTEGLKKAEVCVGGIDTREVDPRSFAIKKHSNIHVIGEALDVTGWLGGYNLQWAWSSAWCCAQML